jgi:hypothetical protein
MAGDVIGAACEANPVKATHFQPFPPGPCFTADTVLTVGTADSSRRLSGVEFHKQTFLELN